MRLRAPRTARQLIFDFGLARTAFSLDLGLVSSLRSVAGESVAAFRERRDPQLQALGALDQWTEPLEDKGVASKIAKAVDTQLASVLAPRIEAYDERTAKDLVSLIRDIEEPARLRRIGRYEAAHKARKTVLGAVEKQLGRLEPKVVELEKWELAAGEEPAVA